MARELARLKLKIEGDTKGLRSSLKGAETQAKRTGTRMSRSFKRAGASVARLTKRMFSLRSAMIAFAGVAVLGLAIKRAIDFADTIGKTAKAAGISAEKLQELRFAARRAGVDVGQLDKALIKFNKTVAEAKTRVSSEFALALDDFNEELVQGVIASRNQEEALDLLADAMAGAATEADKVAIATAAFARVGPKMVLVFRDGTKGISEMAAKARSLGIIFSDELIAKAEIAADELGDMGDVFKTVGLRVALEMIPAMRALAQTFTDPGFIAGVRDVTGAFADLVNFIARHQREIAVLSAAFIGAGVGGRLGGQLGAIAGAAIAGIAAFEGLGLEAEGLSDKIGVLQNNLERLRATQAAGEDLGFFAGSVAGQIAAVEAELGRLQARLGEIREEQQDIQARAPLPEVIVGDPGMAIKLTAALTDARFQIALLRGEFGALAEGIPAAARQIGFTEAELRDLITGLNEANPDLVEFVRVMTEMGDLRAAAQVIEQTATAEEKLAFQTRELNRLKPTLIALLGSEARAQEVINRALKAMEPAARKAADAAQDLGRTFTSAFEDAIVAGKDLSDILLGLEQEILRILLRRAITEPLEKVVTSIFTGIGASIFGSSRGNVIAGGRVVPFQRGGVIDQPIAFGLRGGIGTAGETSPEAILPLRRLPSGDLGVGAVGGGAVIITIINKTGGEAEMRKSAGAQGGIDIEIILDRAVSRLIRGGGLTTSAIQDTFVTALRPIGR